MTIDKPWPLRPLGELAEIRSGGTPRKSVAKYWGGEIPWVTAKDMKAIRLRRTSHSITELGARQIRISPEGSVLILVRGMALFSDLPIMYCHQAACFNQDIKSLVPRENVDGEYLAFALVARKREILQHVDRAGHGTGRIATDRLESALLPLPALAEQRRIAMIIRTLDSGLDRLEALRGALRSRARRLGDLLISGAERFDEFKGQPRRAVRLKEVGRTYSGLSGKSKADFSGEGSHYVPYLNIFDNTEVDQTRLGRVRVLPGERQNRVRPGDVLFTASSETPSEVGMASALVEETREVCYLNSFSLGFRLRDAKAMLAKYLSYYFRTQLGRRSMARVAQGASRYNLSARHLLDLTVSLPCMAEQEKVVACLDASNEVVNTVDELRKEMLREKRVVMRLLLGSRQGASQVAVS